MNIAFIGLGVMGAPMASHLVSKGFKVSGFNRSSGKAQAWAKKNNMPVFDQAQLAATNADIVFICINSDQDIKDVITGKNGILKVLKKNAVIVDHSTASPDLAVDMAQKCLSKSIYFLDAPISGGQAGAENGTLAVMVGGDKQALDYVKDAMSSFAKHIVHIGKSGSGQYTKIVNQICIAGIIQSLAEALNFASLAKLDTKKMLNILSKGAAQSWQMENRAHSMLNKEFDFGFAVDLMRKDLNIALNTAESISAELPVTALIDQFYKKLQNQGDNLLDTSALIKLITH